MVRFITIPKRNYQIITIRIYNNKEDIYLTIAYGIMINKTLNSYIELFDNKKNYTYNNRENKRETDLRLTLTIRCDFEQI